MYTQSDNTEKTPYQRAPGMTQVSFQLPVDLRERIDALAKKTHRSRSQWIVLELSKSVENYADLMHSMARSDQT